MAWLHSAPKTHKNDDEPRQRSELLDEDSPEMEVPVTDSYLAMCFKKSGMCKSGMSGVLALDWQSIWYFCERSGYILNGWESEQVISMSSAYVSMYNKATKNLNCLPPYRQGETKDQRLARDRDIIGAKLNNIFKGK